MVIKAIILQLSGCARSWTTCAFDVTFCMNNAPSAGSIALPVDHQSGATNVLHTTHTMALITRKTLSSNSNLVLLWGIRGTVVVRWTAGQQVERAILRQGHDSSQNSSHSPRLSPDQYSLTVQSRGLKH